MLYCIVLILKKPTRAFFMLFISVSIWTKIQFKIMLFCRILKFRKNQKGTRMQQLDFALIDAHIHQWDPYNTPHAAALAVKLLGKHPYLLDKVVRLAKPKDLIDTLGLTTHITAPYLPQDYQKDFREEELHLHLYTIRTPGQRSGRSPCR